MKDLFERLYEEVVEQAREHKVSKARATKVFMDSYDIHKHKHGSFKHHPEYSKVMSERYTFMRDEAIKYIEEHKTK